MLDLQKVPAVLDITNEQYHGGPGLSNSSIKEILKSPKHYWDSYLNPNKPEREETPSQRFGNMVHTFLLEPDDFKKRYYVMPKVNRGSKDYKEAQNIAEGREIIWNEEEKELYQILKSVREHKFARLLLEEGRLIEKSIYFNDSTTGELLKSRPDCITKSGLILDIKTIDGASTENCRRAIANYKYHMQAAIGVDAFEAAYGEKNNNFINIFIENKRPWCVSPFAISNVGLDTGRLEYNKGLQTYAECKAANYWPGYVDEIEEISLPEYYRTN